MDKDIPAILAGHLTVSTGVFSGSEKCAVFGNDPVFLPSQLALNCFDYVALGHLHRFQNLNSHGYPAVVYSGSIERIDFGERKEEKGYSKVFIDEKLQDKKCNFEFVKIKTRPMIQIDIVLDDRSDQTEQIIKKIKNYDICDAIIKIVYYVPDGKKDNVNLQEIQDTCRAAICLASIVPVRKNSKRELRAELNVDMDISTLLEKYFDTKSIAKEQKDNLLKKAQELYLQFNLRQDETIHDNISDLLVKNEPNQLII